MRPTPGTAGGPSSRTWPPTPWNPPPARGPGGRGLRGAGARAAPRGGAHTPAGAATLARALDDLRPFLSGGHEAVTTLVMGAMADKDVDGIVRALAAAAAVRGAAI